jgi:hypothetical protein
MIHKKATRVVVVIGALALLALTGLALRASNGSKPQPPASSSAQANEELIAKVGKLNAELDRLQATHDPEKQASIFADDIVQMNPNHPMIKGKKEILRVMMALTKKPVRIVSSKTTAIRAWQSDNMIFEYGTTVGSLVPVGKTVDVEDPGDFFIAWASDPASSLGYKVQFSMWNTTKPMAATSMLSATSLARDAAGADAAGAPH